ncbi:hypothetical protein [Parabacteroides timonensis]|uniref:hypothetical protein n=1 Tax=Parabacteroides timonensis TaxID=1871013 RepID=UPI0011153596|nr:hypothetical protein [Parabacteroides timonensis]
MKKHKILTKKQDNLIVAVQNGVGILSENANRSLACKTDGLQLISRIDHEGGMNETLATETESYLSQCRSTLSGMNTARKPFTQQLTDVQKLFVSLENEIDPTKKDSPANELAGRLNAWKLAQIREAEKEEQRLVANFQRTEKRVAGRDDLDEAQKAVALSRAGSRLQAGCAILKMNAIATELEPIVTEPEGYIDLLRLWWQEIGRNLPDSDLQRIFRPMLSYARKQARKNILIDSVYVEYRPVPKGIQAAS